MVLKNPAQTPTVVIGRLDFSQSVNLSFSSLRRLVESMRMPTALASMQYSRSAWDGRAVRSDFCLFSEPPRIFFSLTYRPG
jgi:hypothetical protein